MRIRFVYEELELNTLEKYRHRYPAVAIKESMNLFLRSRYAYQAIQSLLDLPHSITVKN